MGSNTTEILKSERGDPVFCSGAGYMLHDKPELPGLGVLKMYRVIGRTFEVGWVNKG